MQKESARSILQILVLTSLFCAAAVYEAWHISAIFNGDVWWHLRTGLWILQSHAIPRTGLFSRYADLPWHASSWAYEVLLATCYKLLGLRAIPAMLMGLKVALAVTTFLLARASGGNFWASVFLSAAAQYAIPDLQPVPATLSILFFALELMLLVQSRQKGTLASLYWLPPLFLIWANVHVQVVSGLVLLGLFLIALLVEHGFRAAGITLLSDQIRPLPLAKVSGIGALSLVCTLINPYTFHLFQDFGNVLYSGVAFEYGVEMRAMSFRRPQEFALMLLVMAAFLALGRRRSLDIFQLILLIGGAVLAFRFQRDAWLAVLPAVAILADGFRPQGVLGETQDSLFSRGKYLAAALTLTVVAASAFHLPNESTLMEKLSQRFPVKACEVIAQNHLPKPLFNAYSWGGFLTWYLPEYPVAVDGRGDLYGDEILTKYFQVISGKERLETDSALTSAQTLLLERQSGMATALVKLPILSAQYRLMYSDDHAVVFVKQ